MTAVQLDVDDIVTAFLDWDAIAAQMRAGGADERVCRRAMGHPEPRVRRDAASRLISHPDLMTLAAHDTNNEVRQVAASASTTPPEVLAFLVDDRSRVVRELVARNANTPPHAVERLAFDPSPEVRWGVLGRPLSLAAMRHLSRDPFGHLRERFAYHPELPDALRVALAGDHDPRVRAVIARRRAPQVVFDRLVTDPVREVAVALANNPHIGSSVAMVLTGHRERTVRSALARTTSHAEVLDTLADDTELVVRLEVADNSSLSPATALRMMRSPSRRVRRTVLALHHERLPDEVVDRAIEEALCTPDAQERHNMRRLFAHRITPRVITAPPAPDDRRGLFEVVDQCLPFDLIADAVMNSAVPVTVRAGLMEHPLIPRDVLNRLSRDQSPVIQAAFYRPRKRYVPS